MNKWVLYIMPYYWRSELADTEQLAILPHLQCGAHLALIAREVLQLIVGYIN